MTLLTHKNSFKASYLTAIVATILMPDVMLGLIFELLHLLLEGLHIVFECIEMMLDALVEHLFHTDLHQTQVIVFYILCAFASFLIYRLKLALPRYYHRLIHKCFSVWSDSKLRLTQHFTNSHFNP